MVKKYDYIDRLPKIPVQLYEGTRTEYTGQADDGGELTIGVYSAPVEKWDFVKIKDHTTNELVLAEAATAGNEGNFIHGIIIDDPIGEDTVTATGGTPAAAQRRTATMAVFAMGVKEMTVSANAAISPGDQVGADENENNEVMTLTAYASVTTNGGLYSLGYGAAGYSVPVAIGGSFYHPAD